MFYIVVTDNGKQKVIAHPNGQPREFPKHKKAQNFIDGRPYLKNTEIVMDIDQIGKRLRIDI